MNVLTFAKKKSDLYPIKRNLTSALGEERSSF